MNNLQNLKKCFDVHSFEDLNNIDIDIFTKILNVFFQKHSKTENSVFFDIGCNSGSFVKTLQQFGITNVHCFEPHPILATKTKEVYPYIEMNQQCIGNTNENVDMYFPTLSVGLSSQIYRPVFNQLQQEITKLNVKCETLDSYCQKKNIDTIDFLKIDVEGSEKSVFEGALGLLVAKKIIAGIFEIGSTLTDAGTSCDEICELLEKYDYKIDKSLNKDNLYFYC